jgi:hypothetical protein
MLENFVDVAMEMQAIDEGEDFSVYRLVQTKNRLAEPTDDIILAVHSEELGYGFEKVCDTQHILEGGTVSLAYRGKHLGVLGRVE